MSTVFYNGLAFVLPLLVMALSGIYCERSGITNLAVEGFQGFGAFVGAFVAVLMQQTMGASNVPYYVAILMSFIGGCVFALLHALLCIKFKANQVISGVVINIFAMAMTAYLTKHLNAAVFDQASDKLILNVAPKVFGFYTFEPIIIVVVLVAWFVMYKTRFGLYLRACGDNPQAVDAAGVNVAKIRYMAVAISGGFAGLGGICYAYSISSNFSSVIPSPFLLIIASVFSTGFTGILGSALKIGFCDFDILFFLLFLHPEKMRINEHINTSFFI